jgi:hypothetical protein
VNNHQHDNYLSEDSCLTFIIPFTSLIFNDNIFKCKSIENYVLKDHSGVNKCNSEALCSLPSTEQIELKLSEVMSLSSTIPSFPHFQHNPTLSLTAAAGNAWPSKPKQTRV